MEDKKIIFKLQTLKQIKPNQEWAFLLKNEILGNSAIKSNKKVSDGLNYQNVFSNISDVFFQKKLGFALVVLLFVVSGVFGFVNVLPGDEATKLTNNSKATLTGVSEGNNLSTKVKEVKIVVENLTKAIKKNPGIAKDVALELKSNGTLASLGSNTDLQETSDVLYKTIIEQMVKDLESSTLNENQQSIFNDVKKLYEGKKYFEALEKMLSEL